MREIAGLAAVIVIAIGTLVFARAPGAATPGMQAWEVTESQSDEPPAYVQIDPDDWR